MSDARSKYADLVAKHRAAGNTVHEPTQDDPLCYVEVVRDGQLYGPDGIYFLPSMWPLTDVHYEQMSIYLDATYESMKRAGGAMQWRPR